ncbi:MAG: guanylate kinase [Bacteroidia bacterium]|nr:guanylate kinase [Bacteroidia bacterium]
MHPNTPGKLIIFSAPSGAGKTSIVHRLMHEMPNLAFSVSACTREQRPGEVHGKDYYFMTIEEFKQKAANNEFVEWEEVYTNGFYGTLRSEIENIRNSGRHVLFDVDVEGGLSLKSIYGDDALAIFVMPPSVEVLETRLRGRGTENEESLQKRLKKAIKELDYYSKFDVVVLNDVLADAVVEAREKINEFIRTP